MLHIVSAHTGKGGQGTGRSVVKRDRMTETDRYLYLRTSEIEESLSSDLET